MNSTKKKSLALPSIITIIFLTVVCFCLPGAASLHAGFFHADEVSTSWYFSSGYKDNDAVYFLTSYFLFQRPVGIARFPDGGISRSVFNKAYLYRWEAAENRLTQLAAIDTKERGNAISWSTRLLIAENTLRIDYHGRGFVWDMKEEKLTSVPESEYKAFYETNFPKGKKNAGAKLHKIGITELKKELSKLPFSAWNLPSPLEYCKKSNRAYADDLVELRGDQHYRNAIIDKFAAELSQEDIKKILEKMDKKKSRLEGYELKKYEIYSVKTREGLEALLNKDRPR